jgi:hypothetical protein
MFPNRSVDKSNHVVGSGNGSRRTGEDKAGYHQTLRIVSVFPNRSVDKSNHVVGSGSGSSGDGSGSGSDKTRERRQSLCKMRAMLHKTKKFGSYAHP